jgi:UDP-galactopyranose mutase
MATEFDFLIVGSGLYGAVFAREMKSRGKKCLVIDKRPHSGGNVYCETTEGINVHKYGPHIFHTNDEFIWNYVNSFVKFNNFIYSPLANYNDELYNLPFNMNTFYQFWKVKTPSEAQKIISDQVKAAGIKNPENLEELAISQLGTDIYEKLIKYYTKKQWGMCPSRLPSSIIKRLPVRFTYDNNYFNDKYQGIPEGGYNKLIEGLLSGVEVRLNTDFLANRETLAGLASNIVYTGRLDEYFDFKYGHLEYRSLRFEQQTLQIPNIQGVAVVNYTDEKTPYTRIIEHKHFERGNQNHTVITREYPVQWSKGQESYYPINDTVNICRAKKYKELAKLEFNVIFGGRLAEYKYYDMHQVIASALKSVKTLKPE